MKFHSFAAAMLLAVCSLTSCGSGGSLSEKVGDTLLTVDNLFADPLEFVGDTIRVEGVCSHLCAHGGTKAFLQGDSASLILRCQATAHIDGAFSPDCPGHTMEVRGVLREDRVGKADIDSLEKQYMLAQEREAANGSADSDVASAKKSAGDHCNADAKSKGIDTITTPMQRIELMRKQINERLKAEGKDYISYFYLETVSYEVKE